MCDFDNGEELPYHKIIDYLFLGSAFTLHLNSEFSMVVNCTPDIPFSKKIKQNVRIAIDDDPKECSRFLTLIDETNVLKNIYVCIKNREPVLIHCYSGVQRSCALVACYLIKYYNMTPNDAILYIKTRRPVAFFGEVHFLSAIQEFYEKNLK